MKLPVRPLSFVSLLALVPLLTLACSSSDDRGSSSSSSGSSGSSSGASSGASSGGNTSSSGNTSSGASSSGNAGTCTGDVSACTMGSLSDAQMTDTCSLILSAIDSPAGTKFECKEGPQNGLYLTVNSKEQCVAQRPPASCKVKVGELVDCYKSAKKDACAAFAENGACAPLFSPSSGCSGG